jgi:hypothetical protein
MNASLATGGVGGYFGLQSRGQVQSARNAEFLDESVQHLTDARQNARMANTLFAVAGAAAVGAVITYLIRPSEPSAELEDTP